jgi:nucleoside-diphosphate-sugar epimerase
LNRVLVTGGAGMIGAAVVRRLLRDPSWEVRVSDQRPAPDWMREGCEVNTGDLRSVTRAREAMEGCTHVIHLAAVTGGPDYRLLEVNNALYNAVVRAAPGHDVERFVFVSSPAVFERADVFPTPEDALDSCPAPDSADGFSKLTGERYCRATRAEHGLRFTICRPFDPYGPVEVTEVLRAALQCPGDWTRTPTHVDDVADGIVIAEAALGPGLQPRRARGAHAGRDRDDLRRPGTARPARRPRRAPRAQRGEGPPPARLGGAHRRPRRPGGDGRGAARGRRRHQVGYMSCPRSW